MTLGVKTKRIVCLANSRKLNGRCIAGKEILEDGRIGRWVRPVSTRESEEVSEYERQYEDGSEPRVLDVIDVPLIRARPKNYQQENWLLDPDLYWERVRRVSWTDLAQFTDPEAPLWSNGSSTFNGENDQIPLSVAKSYDNSLRLIKVNGLKLFVFQPGKDFGNPKRRVQGGFRYRGTDYRLWVTDAEYERQYLQRNNGVYPFGECYLTVSLAEPYEGNSYKLIAAIIKP